MDKMGTSTKKGELMAHPEYVRFRYVVDFHRNGRPDRIFSDVGTLLDDDLKKALKDLFKFAKSNFPSQFDGYPTKDFVEAVGQLDPIAPTVVDGPVLVKLKFKFDKDDSTYQKKLFVSSFKHERVQLTDLADYLVYLSSSDDYYWFD